MNLVHFFDMSTQPDTTTFTWTNVEKNQALLQMQIVLPPGGSVDITYPLQQYTTMCIRQFDKKEGVLQRCRLEVPLMMTENQDSCSVKPAMPPQ